MQENLEKSIKKSIIHSFSATKKKSRYSTVRKNEKSRRLIRPRLQKGARKVFLPFSSKSPISLRLQSERANELAVANSPIKSSSSFCRDDDDDDDVDDDERAGRSRRALPLLLFFFLSRV